MFYRRVLVNSDTFLFLTQIFEFLRVREFDNYESICQPSN